MTKKQPPEILRAIPPVDSILADSRLKALSAQYPRLPITRLVRDVIDEIRETGAKPAGAPSADRDGLTEGIVRACISRCDDLRAGGLRRILNGTGVVLHTNLGRAVWSESASDAATTAMRSYVSLEVDMESGERSKRAVVLERLLAVAAGGEAAMVVNNNAAAVYLVANSYRTPSRVIVSRGELVEIGGSFRLPEILRHATSELVEVGTTNRTYARDYADVVRAGDLILKVHKSNYEIEGFAHEATLPELVEVAKASACDVVYDLGSGTFEGDELSADSDVAAAIASGVDAITMSGDKLMGGPQAGIIIGKSEYVGRLKQNPLRRALRVDKVTIAALQEVMRSFLFAASGDDMSGDNPSLTQIRTEVSELERRAAAIVTQLNGVSSGQAAAALSISSVADESTMGGGSLTGGQVAAFAVSITCASARAAVELARRFRDADLPVFVRIKNKELRINLTTILPREDDDLIESLASVLKRNQAS